MSLNGKRFSSVWLLLLGAILIALARLYTYDEPMERDIGTYVIMGDEMHHGRLLYRDLPDNKPPGIYVTCYLAEFLTGPGRGEIYLVNIVTCITSMVAAYLACMAFTGDRTAALGVLALWLVISGDPDLQANQPSGESFMNAFALCGLAFLAFAYRKRFAWIYMAAAGFCFGAVTLYKHLWLPAAALLMLAGVLLPHSGRTRRQALTEALLVGGVIAGMWLILAAVLKTQGIFDDFVLWAFTYNHEYAGNISRNIFTSLMFPFPEFTSALWLPLGVALAGLLASGFYRIWQPAFTLLLLALGINLGVQLPGRGYPHYYQLWFPFVLLGFGHAVALLNTQSKWKRLGLVTAAGVPLLLAIIEVPYFTLPPSAWSNEKFGSHFRESSAVGDFLNRSLLPGDTFFQFANEPQLYVQMARRPIVLDLTCYGLFSPIHSEDICVKMLKDLKANSPDAVLVDKDVVGHVLHPVVNWRPGTYYDPKDSPPHAKELIAFWTDSYQLAFPPVGRWAILSRNGSALNTRWITNPPGALFKECMLREQAKSTAPTPAPE